MKRLVTLLCFVLLAGGWAAGLRAAEPATPLVDAAWLARHLGQPGLVVLDVRNKLGGASERTYRAGHVPGAVYSDYLTAGWRSEVDGVPGQLPSIATLEALIGGLGIGEDSHVVVVAGGTSALDMGSATRVYWTFKVLGHDRVSVLDGGYRAYAADPGNPVETGWNEPEPAIFTADFRPGMVADYRDVLAAEAAGASLVDLQPPEQYRGETRHSAAKRAGTIPGAVNLPESSLTTDGGRFVAPEKISALLKAAGVRPDAPSIAFCNTGHWASLGWFAESELLGRKDVTLYDGSMVDWTAHDELPVEVPAH